MYRHLCGAQVLLIYKFSILVYLVYTSITLRHSVEMLTDKKEVPRPVKGATEKGWWRVPPSGGGCDGVEEGATEWRRMPRRRGLVVRALRGLRVLR